MTTDHASDIDAEMAELHKKLIQHPESLYEVFAIHTQLVDKFGAEIDVELDRPVHVGVGFAIQTDGYAGTYFRRPVVQRTTYAAPFSTEHGPE